MLWTTLIRQDAPRPRQQQVGAALFASSKSSSSSSRETTKTRTTVTQSSQTNQEWDNRNHNNGEAWEIYTEIMDNVMRENRVIRKPKQITDEQIQLVQNYLLQSNSLNDVKLLGPPPSLTLSALSTSRSAAATTTKDTSNTTNSINPRKEFRSLLHQRQRAFQEHTNMTSAAFDYCGRALSYVADVCAKHSTNAPCLIAWSKIRECGLLPLENSVSTYMYVLSNGVEEEQGAAAADGGGDGDNSNNKEAEKSLQRRQQLSDSLLEVTAFHDLLYGPNEKSVTLRIKTLVAKGDAAAAEQWLASLPDKSSNDNESDNSDTAQSSKNRQQQWKRLRTYTPILEYYCNNTNIESNNVVAILRLFREMKQSDGVYLDGETYAKIVGTVARQGWFGDIDTTSPSLHNLSQYGFTATTGSALFDELLKSMADDLLEIDEVSVEALQHDFPTLGDSKGDGEVPAARLIARRVSIDKSTAICAETGVKLRLFTLSREQRRQVHDNLLQMAAVEHEEFFKKLQARKRKSARAQHDGTLALKELSRFSDWLRIREGEPFTAFVDGPNVAYFGNGEMLWHQVQLVVDKLESMGENPLVIMPQKYVAPSFWLSRGPVRMLTDDEVAVMNQLVRDKKVYVVPPDCFDDYYWMLGSIAVQKGSDKLRVLPDNVSGRFPGLRPIIVTNDQMRDHRLDLLEERLFRRWTSCHMVKYSIRRNEEEEYEDREVEFFPADFFSHEIQQNVAPVFGNITAWHIPVTEWPKHDRLCLMIVRKEDWTNGSK